jgi:hypothetical protein
MNDSYCSSSVSRQPYFIIQIEALTGLNYLCEDSLSLMPYVKMHIGNSSAVTRVLPATDSIVFCDAFELALDFAEPITIGVYDKDDFGRDVLLSGHCIPSHMFDMFKCPGRLIRLKLNSEEDDILQSDDHIGHSEARSVRASMIFRPQVFKEQAVLDLHLCLMDVRSLKKIRVTIPDYSTVRTTLGGGYIAYNLNCTRYDGTNWLVKLRYSQLSQLRKTLIRQFPEVAELDFPPETSMWSKLFTSSSQDHDKQFIESRRKQLEHFVNALCDMEGLSEAPALTHALQVPFD